MILHARIHFTHSHTHTYNYARSANGYRLRADLCLNDRLCLKMFMVTVLNYNSKSTNSHHYFNYKGANDNVKRINDDKLFVIWTFNLFVRVSICREKKLWLKLNLSDAILKLEHRRNFWNLQFMENTKIHSSKQLVTKIYQRFLRRSNWTK